MPVARLARASDLPSLLALFDVSEVSATARPRVRAEAIWRETLTHGLHVFVSEHRDRIAATCMLIIAPNLLRTGSGHALLKNVAPHPELGGRSHGNAVVRAALEHAWAADCHHVLMQSGRADHRVHAFYEGLGFRSAASGRICRSATNAVQQMTASNVLPTKVVTLSRHIISLGGTSDQSSPSSKIGRIATRSPSTSMS